MVALIVASSWLVLGLPDLETASTVSPKALDAIATRAFAIVAGLGGVALLVIAYQRQSGEATRLFTERFTTAVAQLGEGQSAVRLGGVHALAHLADDAPTPGLRQMCVDVLCAYLRSPDPEDLPQGSTSEQQQAHHERVIEHTAMREVRLTVMRTISERLRAPTPWRDCNYDFTGVTFERALDLRGAVCRGRMAFSYATFAHTAVFQDAVFAADTHFHRASFEGHTDFQRATFKRHTDFRSVSFASVANFQNAAFVADAYFHRATFADDVSFWTATFSADARFWSATFAGDAGFRGTKFGDYADFRYATFAAEAHFWGATFANFANFTSTSFSSDSTFRNATFDGGADFQGTTGAQNAARGVCPKGLLMIAEASDGRVRLPRWWTRPGRVRLKNPQSPQEPKGTLPPR
ncbi:pentapeptide repeat-containing protein [Nocardiopsis dassonvillei]